MNYEVTEITKQVYDLLLKKREAAMKYEAVFDKEGNRQWFEMLIGQTEYVSVPYEEFQQKMVRYIYVVRKK